MGRKLIDLTGRKIGMWTVLRRAEDKSKQPAYICRCDCGEKRHVIGASLKTGDSQNCGCVRRANLGDRARKHGMINHRLYRTWLAMHDRCRRPKHTAYPRYGARGIYVCDRWSEFPVFLADMGPTWQEGLSLDRIDNDGPYSPENCRWATPQVQMQNRGQRLYEAFGERLSLKDWSDRFGIPVGVIRHRRFHGWTLEDAVTRPVQIKRRRKGARTPPP
jgi:hypothetical protein